MTESELRERLLAVWPAALAELLQADTVIQSSNILAIHLCSLVRAGGCEVECLLRIVGRGQVGNNAMR